MELLRIAGLCEKGTGPDRHLDALIWCTLNRRTLDAIDSSGFDYLNESGRVCWQDRIDYTASLDAAASLVPEGMSWRIECWRGDRPEAIARVLSDGLLVVATARSPELALSSAALKAVAASGTGTAETGTGSVHESPAPSGETPRG
jgi:hypothetical protein